MAASSNSNTTRVALYARVSTSDKGQDPEVQLIAAQALAEQRSWAVVRSFVDHGISGASRDRPALDDLLKAARSGEVDVVVTFKLDRLARSLSHLLELAENLRAWGVGLVSVTDAHVDTTTPSGRFTFQILGAVAELERELIRDRVRAGIRRAQEAGTHCGRPRVEIDLRPAVAMLDQGHGLKSISSALGVNRATLRRRLQEADEWPRQGVENPTARKAA